MRQLNNWYISEVNLNVSIEDYACFIDLFQRLILFYLILSQKKPQIVSFLKFDLLIEIWVYKDKQHTLTEANIKLHRKYDIKHYVRHCV